MRVGNFLKSLVGYTSGNFSNMNQQKTTSISCTFLHHNNNNNNNHNNNNQQQITNKQKPPSHSPKEWPQEHPGYLCCCSGLIHHEAEPWTNVVSRATSLYLPPKIITGQLPSSKLTWQWKMDLLKMYSLLKMDSFHCHVSPLEGILLMAEIRLTTWDI